MKLELRNVTKRFGSLVANDKISLTLEPGEIHSLLGENGAGKSTLMNVLYGLLQPDEGQILIDGKEVHFTSPGQAMAAGIGMVHQHFMLVEPFTVVENVVLGAEDAFRIEGSLVRARAELERLGRDYHLEVDVNATVANLTVGQRQRVEILKALYRGAQILILDEPTAVLTPQEARELFANLRRLRDAGKSIVFISHKLDEVLEIADRITVLRRGRVVGETTPAETSKAKLAEMMVGRPVLFRLEKPAVEPGAPVLEVHGMTCDGKVHGVDLAVRAGEILGVAGVEGNGQRELAEAILGLRPITAGSISVDGRDLAGMPEIGRAHV